MAFLHAVLKVLFAHLLVSAACAQSAFCPDTCYALLQNGEELAKLDCELAAVDASALCKLKKCTFVNSNGVVEPGVKCGCVKCPDNCETKFGLARKLFKKCRKQPYKTDCKPLPCMAENGKPGLECTCPKGFTDCPGSCRPGKLGKLLAKAECATKPNCKNTGKPCKVLPCDYDTQTGVKKGSMCGCNMSKCPNSCYTDVDLMPMAAEECAMPHMCPDNPDGACKLRACFNNGIPGRGCACRDPAPCPKICHTDKNSEQVATADCATNVRCPLTNTSCVVETCERDGKRGHICQCESFPSPTPTLSPTPSVSGTPSPSHRVINRKCPNTCYTGKEQVSLAKADCSGPRFCIKGDCRVRKCVWYKQLGTACACVNPGNCPHVCHTVSNAFEIATNECNSNRYCLEQDQPCAVDKCTNLGISGYSCSCPKFVPSPSPCPNVCYINKEIAYAECKKSLYCPILNEQCTVKNCVYKGDVTGFTCTCASAFEPCSGICRTGPDMDIARDECQRGQFCPTSSFLCTVQECLNGGLVGLKCACPA